MRLALALLLAAGAAAAPAPVYEELPPGRYSMQVTGLISTICSRAVVREWSRLPEVEKVTVDFESGRAVLLVRLDRTLKAAALRKALRRAERLSNLGGRFDFRDVTYVP